MYTQQGMSIAVINTVQKIPILNGMASLGLACLYTEKQSFPNTQDKFTIYRNAWNIMDFIVVTSG